MHFLDPMLCESNGRHESNSIILNSLDVLVKQKKRHRSQCFVSLKDAYSLHAIVASFLWNAFSKTGCLLLYTWDAFSQKGCLFLYLGDAFSQRMPFPL